MNRELSKINKIEDKLESKNVTVELKMLLKVIVVVADVIELYEETLFTKELKKKRLYFFNFNQEGSLE